MRAIEILIILAIAILLVLTSVPAVRRPRWYRILAAGTAGLTLIQLIFEGYRWQMVPAYALVFILGLAALRNPTRAKEPK
jgi:hypothetical protein